MKLRLHNYWRSSASYRVRIALGLKGLAWEYLPVHLMRGGGEQKASDYRRRNPMAQVPTLEISEDDGTVHHLSQSLAILEYLDERWPAPALLPADRQLRARARALAEIVNSGIQPLQNLSVMRKVVELGGDDRTWAQGFIRDGLAAFAALTADVAGRFCVGDTPTVADLCLVPQLYAARRFGASPDEPPPGLEAAFALLTTIEAACNQIPAFADAHPDRQPDAQS